MLQHYRLFIDKLCQYFGVRRHAKGICESIEAGTVDAFCVANMLVDGEGISDTTVRFMQGFCCRIAITDVYIH